MDIKRNRCATGLSIAAMMTLALAGCSSGGSDDDSVDVGQPPSSAFPVKVGQVGPIAADNARQAPFGCQTFVTTLGQPEVDNQNGVGYPVTDPGGPAPADHGAIEEADIVGYSADCGAPTRVDYYYRSTVGGKLKPLEDPNGRPDDLATIEVNGSSVNYIVRHELGTINRFIYSIYVLTPEPGAQAAPDLSAWNNNLVYSFGGGVGIGYSQSNGFINNFVKRPDGRDLHAPLLENGYAIIASTGTGTNTTYNLRLTGHTAEMVKQQFVSAYARPHHTFGVGGSGGAIQQTIYEQNHPDLLDALMPLETFGDMITQLNPVGDCELLEFYFDQADAAVNGTGSVNPKWTDWENRQWIEGLNAINGAETDFDDGSGSPIGSSAQPGSSECIEGWRGLAPLVLNPEFVAGDTYDLIRETEPDVFAATKFDYFDDLEDIFGINPQSGYARSTYDNVGVQYGLAALNAGDITVDEFLLLNAHVGGYKDSEDQVPEGFPFGPQSAGVDPWSSRNATARDNLDPEGIAPRTAGDLAAMRAAYNAGLVFLGDIDDPMLILDAYLEPELNMHHSREKFEIRQRMLEADGDATNLVLWAAQGDEDETVADLVLSGLDLLETWLDQGMKPVAAQDACFNADGSQIARGAQVWNGILTGDTTAGACVADFPIYGSARTVAGDNLTGYTFKCAVKSVDTALTDATYADSVVFSDDQKARLKAVFADGVCDYSQPDQARPDGV
jgi:hypothetical protein